jgi:anti-sigma regulatory factor (Ser/Thr protein kinase)
MTRQPAEVFFSYSHRDEKLRDGLQDHLALLQRENVITGWHDRKIGAGDEWRGQIDEHLELADIILLLVSASFLASDYCYDVELARALERHDAGEARVIPVILRPVDWTTAPFARLQALPRDAQPVTTWRNRDQAYANIAEGLRKVVLEPAEQVVPTPGPVVPADATTEAQRWYERLSGGSIEVELDPNLRSELFTFISVVDHVLREKGFRPNTVDRVAIILRELLTNVARHVPRSRAWTAIKLQRDWVEFVSIGVCDSGPGINSLSLIEDHQQRLVQGDHEHGLLRVARLTDNLSTEPPRDFSTDGRHGIWCEVFDPEPPPSVLFKYEVVAPVCVVYKDVSPIWLGPEEAYTGNYFIETLSRAVERDWRPLLDLYFAPLLSSDARYLGLEVSGYIYTSLAPRYTFPNLAAALEMYFQRFFEEKRVIVLIHDTDRPVYKEVKHWAQRWELEYFKSRSACRQRLEELEQAHRHH